MNKEELPYICPSHPKAQILHTWDQTHSVIAGYPAGTGVTGNHKWKCNECGRELAPPKKEDK